MLVRFRKYFKEREELSNLILIKITNEVVADCSISGWPLAPPKKLRWTFIPIGAERALYYLTKRNL